MTNQNLCGGFEHSLALSASTAIRETLEEWGNVTALNKAEKNEFHKLAVPSVITAFEKCSSVELRIENNCVSLIRNNNWLMRALLWSAQWTLYS